MLRTLVLIAVFGWLLASVFLGNPQRSDPLGFTNWLFIVKVPAFTAAAIRRFFGERGFRFFHRVYFYICWSPNPILLVAYVVLMGGGFALTVYHVFPLVPCRLLGSWHRYTVSALIVACFWLYVKACTADPGYITEATITRHEHNYPYDNAMFRPTQCCTCKHTKPARSKHCSITNRCVARFDHYCAWLAQPVGEGNYRYFLGYILVNSVTLMYGAICLALIMMSHVMDMDLFNATFYNRHTREEIKASPLVVLQFMLVRHQFSMGLLAMCSVMGLVVFGFFLYHLYLLWGNQTTNEAAKRSMLAEIVEKNQEVVARLTKLLREREESRTGGDKAQDGIEASNRKKTGSDDGKAESKAEAKEEYLPKRPSDMTDEELIQYKDLVMRLPTEMPTNPYDHGFWSNLREVLYPLSQRPRRERVQTAQATARKARGRPRQHYPTAKFM